MFASIVVGVDGRLGGHEALALAADLAASPWAVTAVHVDEHAPRPRLDAEALAVEMRRAGARGRTRIERARSAGHALTTVAAELDADLIVIGRAHHGPVGRLLAGDTTRAVIRGARRPVAVAGGGRDLPLGIGVGYDGTAAGDAALSWAAEAAATLRRPLHVTCAAQPVHALAPSALSGVHWEDGGGAARADAEADLAAALERCGPRAAGAVVHRRPVDALLELSERVGLLVVGTRGEHGLSRMLLGSTSDALVHRAACPVVAVPGVHAG